MTMKTYDNRILIVAVDEEGDIDFKGGRDLKPAQFERLAMLHMIKGHRLFDLFEQHGYLIMAWNDDDDTAGVYCFKTKQIVAEFKFYDDLFTGGHLPPSGTA